MVELTHEQVKEQAVDTISMTSTLGVTVQIMPDGRLFNFEAEPNPFEITAETIDELVENIRHWKAEGNEVLEDDDEDLQYLYELVRDLP